MIKIICCVCLLMKCYLELNIIQQRHYHLESFFSDYKKNFIKYNIIFLLIIPILFYNNILLNVIVLILAFLYMGSVIYKLRIKLKFTKKMRRITLVCFFFAGLLFVSPNVGYFCAALLAEFIAILSILIMHPIDRLIYKRYYNKTKNKLMNLKLIKIGITGSFGKTSTKNFMYHLLKDKYITYMTPSSYNTPMGISKSVSNLSNAHEIFVCEMGASYVGDIKELFSLVNPNITVITAIHNQHLNTFKTLENIVNEKLELVNNQTNGVCFINDIVYAKYKNKINTKAEIITYGEMGQYNYKIKECSLEKTVFDVYKKHGYMMTLETKVIGRHNVSNILVSIAVADYLGVNLNAIKYAVKHLKNVNARLSVTKTDLHTIINDGFNANLMGAKNAIDYLKQYDIPKCIITSGFVEIDLAVDEEHRKLAEYIDGIDTCILVGKKQTDFLYNLLCSKEIDLHRCDSFMEAYSLFKEIYKDEEACLLIENDLTDIYL